MQITIKTVEFLAYKEVSDGWCKADLVSQLLVYVVVQVPKNKGRI